MDKEKCLYDRWFDGEQLNLNQFTIALFKAFQFADGLNRSKILQNWSEYFKDSENI